MIDPPVDVRLAVLPEVPCPYLPARQQRVRAVHASAIDGENYRAFMDAGFRRSGRMLYQNVCVGCSECISLRVIVAEFAASSSQNRSVKRNHDLRVDIQSPLLTDEKFTLYSAYVSQWHGRDSEADFFEFQAFLYDSPTETLEFTYRSATGQLLAVGICDVSSRSLSSVYFYFDPAAAKRGLGTYGAMREIAFCRQHSLPYYYLGFWVRDCAAMSYKANFRPYEMLDSNGNWHQPQLG